MRVPLDATPLGGHRLTSGPSTATTRAPSVSGVIGWVLAARRASPNVGARTGSICARVALRRVVPCATPEALGVKIGHLKREVNILSEGFSEAKTQIADLELALATDPNAKLRFKIKRLCLRYHPDKASVTALSSEDVTRDLLELLN